MTHRRLREVLRSRPLAATLLLTSASLLAPALAGPPTSTPLPGSGRLTVVERVLTQDQGDWQSRLLSSKARSPWCWPPPGCGAPGRGLAVQLVVACIFGRSECVIAGQGGPMAAADVISSPEESLRCRERAVIRVWAGKACDSTPTRRGDPEPLTTVTVEPGGLLRVGSCLRAPALPLRGDYDPLLGRRAPSCASAPTPST